MAAKARSAFTKLKSLSLVTVGGSVVFAGLCINQGHEKFYKDVLMPLTRFLPPETNHKLAVWACKYKLVSAIGDDDTILGTKFFHLDLKNPIGIAAGFDKQGEAVEGLRRIGFGFVEIGTVTPEPQPGNPTPRVFRLNKDEAIINRYGFNSDGHRAVYERLKALKHNKNFSGVLGINLGKNKNSSITSDDDYVKGVQVFGCIADYLAINISSPNTPGLRDLQSKQNLEKLLLAVLEARNNLATNKKVPILLKLAPDLTKQDIKDIAAVVTKESCRVDGLIVSNTTTARINLQNYSAGEAMEAGGLSGKPLREKSTNLIAEMYYATSGKIPIIGVGGISNGKDAFEKLEAGASYLQLYTSFIYHGPPIVNKIKKELSDILKEKGYNSINQVVGSNYKKYLNK